jgi:hypothetical protein
MKILDATLILGSIITLLVVYSEFSGLTNIFDSRLPYLTLCVGLLIPFSLLFFGYVALRSPGFFVLYVFIAILMLLFYTNYSDHPRFQLTRGSALDSFRSLSVFLFLFVMGRILFRRITGREYVTPTRGGGDDLLEGRAPSTPDFIFFTILFFAIIGAQEL